MNREMLGSMIMLATRFHEGQFDKGGQPYILHPLKVMYLLKTDDEELQCIAVGHDLLEDTDCLIADLRFEGKASDRVVSGIWALTKQPGQSFDEYKNAVKANYDAIRVKLCDLRHNSDLRRLKGVGEKDLARVQKYAKFYDELLTARGKFENPKIQLEPVI